MPTYQEKYDSLVDIGFAHDSFLSCFKPLDEFEEEEATWLIPGWLPDGQITTLAADGGIGKTSLWCNIVASVSSGTPCLLDPPGHTREPQIVAFFTTEDSVRKTLRKKLRLAGANMKNIITPDFLADKSGELQDFKFGSPLVEQFIRHFKPALCVFDPIQGFVPPEIQMGSRNAMRDCMAPLVALGEECGTTSLVICHTNKRSNASGRSRMADSADLWDISRSVIMAGYTEEQGIRYLSNEKNNYAQRRETILFSIDGDGLVQHEGTSWKRDHEYMQEEAQNKAAPKREDCKEFLLNLLVEGGVIMPANEVDTKVKSAGYSDATCKRAKSELKKDGRIRYFQKGSNDNRVWFVEVLHHGEFAELEQELPVPWEVPPSATQK
jgi:RecA-family ATPase